MSDFFANPSFMPFPFQYFLPRPHQQQEEKEPPMRVRVAMDYLRLLTHKTSDGAVPHGVGAEVIAGQKLVPAETAAQTAACELLKIYFHGDLEPDVWEEKQQEEQNKVDEPGKLISCFLCQARSHVDPNCSICRGTGTILVYPTGGE